MSGAAFALFVNMTLALLIAAAFWVLARSASARGVRWFAASYAIGAGTPLSELLVRATPFPQIFVFSSFATFSLAFHVMAAGLARYYSVPLPRWLLPGSFGLSITGRLVLWDAPRGVLFYEFCYQLPFTFALAICTGILARGAPARLLDRALTVVFALTALHFLAKPFAATMAGSGTSPLDYIHSRYALISQSMTAIMLIAVALSLILVVVTDLLEVARWRADIDELSNLANRRAFDRDAAALMVRQASLGLPCSALLFDLDRFKDINDTHGHAAGDDVIRHFAAVLQRAAPVDAILGRMGGEEFAVMLAGAGDAAASELAERVRKQFAAVVFIGEQPFRASASCGLAVARHGETLSAVMIRADRALYRAKADGRDRVAVST